MIKDYSLFLDFDYHLLGDNLKAVHVTFFDIFDVMVTEYEVYLSIQAIKKVIP